MKRFMVSLLIGGWWFIISLSGMAQARVEALLPEDASLTVHRLGSTVAERVAVGMDDLLPGDLLESGSENIMLTLRCPADGPNTYLLSDRFRVLIDVPQEAACHVNLLGGRADVLAEDTTETTGGVPMGSTSTQYAVEVRRTENGPEQKLIVFDGDVYVRLPEQSLTINQGRHLILEPVQARVVQENISSEEITQSARLYTRYDLYRAEQAGLTIPNRQQAEQQLQTLHYEVLLHPQDQAKRVDLAKMQIEYEAVQQAAYNLRQAKVVEEADLQRYEIDPDKVRPYNQYPQRLVPDDGTGRDLRLPYRSQHLPRLRTTDYDLELIAAGRPEEAVQNLNTRIEQGSATSRDYYALVKAYIALGDHQRALGMGRRAQALNQRDGTLSDREQNELEQILQRLGR